jgi:membrane dipeptidase
MIDRFGMAIAAALLLATPAVAKTSLETRAAAIHGRILVLDSHADVLLPETPKRYFLPGGGSRADLAHLEAGGVDAIVLALAVGPGPRDAAGVAAARAEVDRKLGIIQAFVAGNAQKVGLARSADDIERLRREGKIAVLIGFQNARSIGSDLSQIDVFYREGVRVFAFNHAGHNDFADSSRPGSAPVAEHGGLSPLGRDAVKRLNDLGILIDVSQLSTDALLQTLQLTRAPVAATHSAARALVDNVRNLSDAELDAIKANRGVVQVTPFSAYVHQPSPADRAGVAEVRSRYGLARDARTPYDGVETLSQERRDALIDDLAKAQARGTLSEFVDHIDYIARRIGWQHVGIGTDFDHGAGVIGFNSEADAASVTAELLRRGYSEKQIAAIWGGNFLRVLRAAEAARAKLPIK